MSSGQLGGHRDPYVESLKLFNKKRKKSCFHTRLRVWVPMPAMVPLIWPDDIVLRRNERFRSILNSCQNMSSQLQIFSEIHQFTFLGKNRPFFPKCDPRGQGAFNPFPPAAIALSRRRTITTPPADSSRSFPARKTGASFAATRSTPLRRCERLRTAALN